MASGQERVLRRRIKSVQSTKKITKAMELISASRIAKAQERVAAARPYSERITDVIRNLAAAGAGGDSPLLNPRAEVTTTAYVVVAADRGLAGGYNSSVIRAAERAMVADQEAGRQTALITVGKKATGYFRFRGWEIAESFVGFSDAPSYEDARAVASHVAAKFESGEYSEVHLAYTQFLSMGSQLPQVVQYMPLDTSSLDDTEASGPSADYEFEPNPSEILDRLLPRYAEARLYAALLDSAASEHAARQRAMKSATENAEEMIIKLSRVMNRARQDAITTEIMEIVGGAEALRQSQTDGSDLLVDKVNIEDVFNPHHVTAHRTDHFSSEEQS
ncbi:MAG TPA: F0F1 ATP synthase subunit gamma [Acidimicrobiales bacterium]|nr:F0F1 ATP synthase subunit gamma [Acidimicrobiales bacterium]